jgi:predicted dinucleotide-binding enzyme
MATHKIGILGSGQVGQTLATGFLRLGHEVMVGTRDPEKLSTWQVSNAGIKLGSFEEAAAFGDLAVLAVKGSVAIPVVKSVAGQISGKTVIDTTNPIADIPPDNGVLHYFTTMEDSLMERLQQIVPSARFVKAFNSVGNQLMVNPNLPGGKPTMFICGNDADAKTAVSQILDVFGWEVEDLGTVVAARAIEPLCMLWCIPGFRSNQWTHALKLLRAQ